MLNHLQHEGIVMIQSGIDIICSFHEVVTKDGSGLICTFVCFVIPVLLNEVGDSLLNVCLGGMALNPRNLNSPCAFCLDNLDKVLPQVFITNDSLQFSKWLVLMNASHNRICPIYKCLAVRPDMDRSLCT